MNSTLHSFDVVYARRPAVPFGSLSGLESSSGRARISRASIHRRRHPRRLRRIVRAAADDDDTRRRRHLREHQIHQQEVPEVVDGERSLEAVLRVGPAADDLRGGVAYDRTQRRPPLSSVVAREISHRFENDARSSVIASMSLYQVCAKSRFTASWPFSALRHATITCQSCVSASARAHSKPKPALAPVTMAVFMSGG